MNYNYLFERENLATSYGVYFDDDRTLHVNEWKDSETCRLICDDMTVAGNLLACSHQITQMTSLYRLLDN